MGCGACTSAKQPVHLPKAPLSQKVAGGVFAELSTLPSPGKYRSRLFKWTRIRLYRGEDVPPFVAFYRDRPAKFTEKLGKGPSCEYRWEVWRAATGVTKSSRYQELLTAELSEQTQTEIEKDVLRTYFEIPYFKTEGKQALTNVLSCLAKENAEVGYCQGLNFVVGLLLVVSGGLEQETFDFYSALRKEKDWCGLYVNDFPKVWELTYQWRVLFKQKDEELYRHFKSQGVVEGLWLTRCVLTVFAAAFPIPLAVRLWDLLLTDDNSFFLKVAWTLVELLRSDLMGKDLQHIAETMRNVPKRQFDIESFVRDVRRVNVSKAVMDKGLEKHRAHLAAKAERQGVQSSQVNVEV